MRAGEMAGGERAGDRQLARERERRADFGERAGFARAAQAENVEARRLTRQTGAAAHGADHQVRQRHRGVEPAVLHHLEARHADRRLRDARGILAARDVERGEAVRIVTVDADTSAHHAAERRHAPVVDHRRGRRVQPLLDERRRQHHLGAHLLPPHQQKRLRRRLLVAGEVRLDVRRARLHRRFGADVLTDRVGRDRHHVLTGCVSRRVLEREIDVIALDGHAHVRQLAVARRRLRDLAEFRERGRRPHHEHGPLRSASRTRSRARASRLR